MPWLDTVDCLKWKAEMEGKRSKYKRGESSGDHPDKSDTTGRFEEQKEK